ncbi:unnamed protein product, partial [Rotaria sp. Silwood2]
MAIRIKYILDIVSSRTKLIRNNSGIFRAMSSVTNKEDADSNHIFSLIDGYRCSQTLFTAVSFKLFDHLTTQELSLEELANKLNLSHLSSLERFLNACISLKLIQQDKINKKYSNTQLSDKYLV